MNNMLNDVTDIVRAAGATIMGYYRDRFSVTDKSPDNPVTDADFAADRLLKERLLDRLPSAGWLSEETEDNPDRLEHKLVWVVDPLDGTKEFILGIPEFSVSVALVDEGQPIVAVVFNPATGELFQGQRGEGFLYNGWPAQVSGRARLVGARIDASRSEVKAGEFVPFGDQFQINIVGSIAYKLARVAAGLTDATWSRGPKNEWDICAGALLVEIAGGRSVSLTNEPLIFNKRLPKSNGIIASNGRLHEQIVATLGPLGAARA
jgi:myo-inositol-1(or 4)-monophosphatase